LLGSRLKLAAIFILLPSFLLGQGLTYNSSWGFQTPNDLSTSISRLDLEERKKGGFYDGFQTETNYDGNTFLTYDCTGSSATNRANESVTSVSAQTSSPTTGSEVKLGSEATGNDQQSSVLNKGAIDGAQEATGDVESETNLNLTTETGVINAGGGSNKQDSETGQANSGNLMASAETGVGCNFFNRPSYSDAQVPE